MKFSSFKYWLSLNKRIWKNTWNKLLIGILLLLIILDFVYGTRTQGIATIVIMVLWGHLLYIEWLKEQIKK